MQLPRRSTRLMVLHAFIVSFGLFVAFLPPGSAAIITVNSTADVIANDGTCSLREAVGSANTNTASGGMAGECAAGDAASKDLIEIPAGTFVLSLGGSGEDANLEGDLDITERVTLRGAGRGDTIIHNGIGSGAVLGDGDRLIHIDPAGSAGNVHVTLSGMTLRRGDVGCMGDGCERGAAGIQDDGTGDLRLTNCKVTKNTLSCSGTNCGNSHDSAALKVAGGDLTINKTIIVNNSTSCSDEDCDAGNVFLRMDNGGDLTIEQSTISDNTATCSGLNCRVTELARIVDGGLPGNVTIGDSVIADNSMTCTGEDCNVQNILEMFIDGTLSIIDSEIKRNTLSCNADMCDTDEFLNIFPGGLVITNSNISGNTYACTGQDCRAERFWNILPDLDMTISGSTIRSNSHTCSGLNCQTRGFNVSVDGHLTITDTIIRGNINSCTGDNCQSGQLDGFMALHADLGMSINTTQIFNNTHTCDGMMCTLEPFLEFDTGGDFTSTGNTIESNTYSCTGTDCVSAEFMILDVGGQVTIN